MKTTAGQWLQRNPLTPYTQDRIHQVIKTNDAVIAYIPITKDFYTAEANSKLISAAPDLLEALEKIIAITDRKHDVWDFAKDAISKAKGLSI